MQASPPVFALVKFVHEKMDSVGEASARTFFDGKLKTEIARKLVDDIIKLILENPDDDIDGLSDLIRFPIA